MELFGMDLSFELDEKQQKIAFYVVTVSMILLCTHLFVVKPIASVSKSKKNYKNEVIKYEKLSETIIQREELYKVQLVEYDGQKEKHDELATMIHNASIQNNAVLKEVVQKIADYLDVDIVSIGSVESRGELVNEIYEKKYIPYTVEGGGKDIEKLLYYLENSSWLLNLRDSGVDLKRSGSGAEEKVRTTFKLGAYYFKSENEESIDAYEN